MLITAETVTLIAAQVISAIAATIGSHTAINAIGRGSKKSAR